MRPEIRLSFALCLLLPGCNAPAPRATAPVMPAGTVDAPALAADAAPAIAATPTSVATAEPDEPSPAATPSRVATPGPVAEPVETSEPSRTLEVVARLVEPRSTSHCGYFHFVVVMRYELVRVVAGTYTARDLYVAHSCPELLPTRCRDAQGDQLRKYVAGDVHHLRLRLGKGDGTLVDKFADKALPRYRAQCVDVVAPA